MSEKHGWKLRTEGAQSVIALSGDWIACARGVDPGAAPQQILATETRGLAFESDGLERWDSALIAFLSVLRDAAEDRGIAFDDAGLPAQNKN